MPLRRGQYFLADAEGLPVRDGRPGREGQVLGRVAEILSGAASPLLSVDTGRCRVLVPAVAAFVREVVPGSHVTVTPIDGMFDGKPRLPGTPLICLPRRKERAEPCGLTL